jgi:enoyl-CoA hydratase/carnithine racemase
MQETFFGNNTVILKQDSPVSWLVINREDKRNALNQNVITGLIDAIDLLTQDPKTRLIALTGMGEKAFCAGADLSSDDLISANTSDKLFEDHKGRKHLSSLFLKMWECHKPIVAAVRGYAIAGGFGLACACDLIYASSDAQFGASEVKVGLWPYIITVPILNSLSPKKAFELMVTGRKITADEALELGIVNKVTKPEQLEDEIQSLGIEIAQGAPIAIGLGKESFYNALNMDKYQALEYLRSMLSFTLQTQDAKEGINAFLEKRKPRWIDN